MTRRVYSSRPRTQGGGETNDEEEWAMMGIRKAAVFAWSVAALAGGGMAALAAADTAAEEAHIRGINDAWVKAYNAANADGLAALYADDAVLSPPGVPAARGRAA